MRAFFSVLVLFLASCSETETLRVRQFHLRDTKPAKDNEFIRAEMNKRLYGAVTLEERQLRRGDYYDIAWHGLSGTNPVRVVFEYRQAATGAEERKIDKAFPVSRSGKTEFHMIGEAYREGGRIVAWRLSLYDGLEKVAQKQSYLWD